MTIQDINRIYTDKVSELLNQGFQIHAQTMSGSQGEIAHIDLTDGFRIYRVLMESEYNIDTGFDSIRIRVGISTDLTPDKTELGRNTIWNNHLEDIFQIEFAKITNRYFATLEESERMAHIRNTRWRLNRKRTECDLGTAYKSTALRWLRKQPRMKSCQLEDITRMVKEHTRAGVSFRITAKGKTYTLATKPA